MTSNCHQIPGWGHVLPWLILPEQQNPRLMMEDIRTGIDELGVSLIVRGPLLVRTPPFDRPRQGAGAAQ
jgi:hypothetical protein